MVVKTRQKHSVYGDTLGKGTLRMYPSSRVPTHPFRVIGFIALGRRNLGELSMCKNQDSTLTCYCDPT